MSDGGGSASTGQEAEGHRAHLTGAPLLAALARLSSTLQPPRTTRGELLRIAGEGLAPLGLHLALLKVDGPLLALEFIFPRDALIDEVERLLRQPVEGTACPIELAPLSLQVLQQRQFAYSDQILEGAVRFLTTFPGNNGLHQVLSRSAFQRGVVAPVYARGEPYGVLVVCADWLTEDDVPAVGLFGMQLSSALSVAEATKKLPPP